MDQDERAFHVWRIVSARLPVGDLVVTKPSPAARFHAECVYRETLRDAELEGCYDDDEMLALMIAENLWSWADQARLDRIDDEVSGSKATLYETHAAGVDTAAARLTLDTLRRERASLFDRRHAYAAYTTRGAALLARNQALLAGSVRRADGLPCGALSERRLTRLMEAVAENALDEAGIREIARNEPWASTWALARHAGRGLFDCPSVEMSDEQKVLVYWSHVYDAVRESPDCPADDVIGDDDLFDGWMLVQRRKREKSRDESDILGRISPEVARHEEVFIVARSDADRRKIESLNTVGAKIQKRQMLTRIERQGSVREEDFAHRQQQKQMLAANEFSRFMRQKSG